MGEKVAADIASGKISHVIALSGDLGSGKTTFVQGVARGLGIKGRIISPTFILMRRYPVQKAKNETHNLYHVDLYRLEGSIDQEILNLGLPYVWSEPTNIVVIEWAEKIEKLIPAGAFWIKFEQLEGNKRKIFIA